LFLLSCKESFYLISDVAFTNKEKSVGRWYIYYGDKYVAWLSEDAGAKAILIIPARKHGHEFQFKKIMFTVVDIEEDNDTFTTTIVSDEGIEYIIKLHSRQQINQRFIAWIPR